MRPPDFFFSSRFVPRACRRLFLACFAAALPAVVFFPASLAQASILEIQFTGLDLDYDGANIYDSKNHNTSGSGNPADADPLTSMSFLMDGNLVGTVVTTNIFADIYIAGVTNVPKTGGMISSSGNGGSFGIDLLTSNSNPGWGLALDIDTMSFFYTGSKIAISVAGTATNIANQQLPFGLAFDPSDPVTIILSSANLTAVTTGPTYLTGFKAAGTGNVAGTADSHGVPEPATLALAGMGLASLLAFCRGRQVRRRAARR